MKLLSSFIFFISTIQISAQDPQLYEHTWYLEGLIIDGVSNPPPKDGEAATIWLRFDEGLPNNMNFQTFVCREAISMVEFNDPSSSFNFMSPFSTAGIDCTTSEALAYQSLYFDFYRNEIALSFFYQIDVNSNNIILTVDSQSGNQAIYSNQLLSVEEDKAAVVEIFPNPANHSFELLLNNINLTQLVVFDISGKKVMQIDPPFSNSSFDISHLNRGLYLVHIETPNAVVTKKLIKR